MNFPGTFFHYNFGYSELKLDDDQLRKHLHINPGSSEDELFQSTMKCLTSELVNYTGINGGYKIFPIEDIDKKESSIKINNTYIYPGKKIVSYLNKCTFLCIFVCTGGNYFTVKTKEYFDKSDYLDSYITDLLGAFTVESAMDLIQISLEKSMENSNLSITNRYSPGYCGWPLNEQQILFKLLGSTPTGISLTDSSLMIPVKSVSGIIGIGHNVMKGKYECDLCNFPGCHYRNIRNK